MEEDFSTFEGRERARRQMAIDEWTKKTHELWSELDKLLKEVRDNPNDLAKLEALKKLTKGSEKWGERMRRDPAALARDGGASVRAKAQEILKEFGWEGENS